MAETVGWRNKPIAFGSRYLNDSEKNYTIVELELVALVWGLEKFRFYLYGKKIIYIPTTKHLNSWLEEIDV